MSISNFPLSSEPTIPSDRILTPIMQATPGDRFAFTHVPDNALTGDGINDGDLLIIMLTFENSDLTPGRLVIINTPVGLLVRHLYQTLDKHVRLVSSNASFPDMVYPQNAVHIRGIIVGVGRDFIS